VKNVAYGDTEKQVLMRQHFIKHDEPVIEREGVNVDDFYINEVAKRCSEHSMMLDIGTGTGHIPLQISRRGPAGIYIVAMDVSKASVEIAKKNARTLKNVEILRGDGYNLPFKDGSFDLAICRLAPHSIKETHRVLKTKGCYVLYGYGHTCCWKELEEVFGNRVMMFCEQEWWKTPQSRLEKLKERGFKEVYEVDFLIKEYYTMDQIQRRMEFDPIIKEFHRRKDKTELESLKKKFSIEKGIRLTGDPVILFGTK